MAFISQKILMKSLSKSNLTEFFSIKTSFLFLFEKPAMNNNSMTSRNNESIFEPSVYLEVLEMFGRYSCHSLYAEISFWRMGKTVLGGGVEESFL